MTPEKFAEELDRWKQELLQEVIPHFQAANSERGDLAFERWKDRFQASLEDHLPDEAKRFIIKTHHFAFTVRRGEHPLETFMREDGRTCLAFIDDLKDSILKGRIKALDTDQKKQPFRLTSSPKVFLSYAREDITSARRLYKDLLEAGADVWFDYESLLPGQKWRLAIREAIRDSRYFIALLSNESVNKKGFVQKEIKDALEILDEYPQSSVFVIPVRLDACNPADERLRDLHWVDLFPDWDDGLDRVLRALCSQKS